MLGLIMAICFDVDKSRDPPGQNGSRILHGVAAVEGGREKCRLCDFPMDPDGHICPRWN